MGGDSLFAYVSARIDLSGVLCRRTSGILEQNESGSFAQLEKIFRTGKRREKPVYRRGQDSRLEN